MLTRAHNPIQTERGCSLQSRYEVKVAIHVMGDLIRDYLQADTLAFSVEAFIGDSLGRYGSISMKNLHAIEACGHEKRSGFV